LFITENYAALRILEHFLLGDLSEEKPLVLFGSRFPKENEFTKVIAALLVLSSYICVDEITKSPNNMYCAPKQENKTGTLETYRFNA